jgi:hypothetical protein
VITPNGQRAYEHAASGELSAFDLESFQGTLFAQVGNAILRSSPVGASPVLTTSVDGRTVFTAGDDRLAVVSGPP